MSRSIAEINRGDPWPEITAPTLREALEAAVRAVAGEA